MLKHNFYLYLILCLSFLILSCDPENEEDLDLCNPAETAGEVIESKFLGSYGPDQVRYYLDLFGAPPGLTPDYAVDAYKIVYKSRDLEGELVTASGVLFIPEELDTLSLLSIQHGTEFHRDQVGSVNALYAFDGLITAMAGYMVFEPDGLGLGESAGIHPYLHAELSANPVIDGIRAARHYACQEGISLDGNLFLAGYSEGGFVTMAAHKAIEEGLQAEFQLTAVAPMAGPYDLVGTTRSILNRQQYSNPGYIAYVAAAYNDIYGWDKLDEIFREPYASRIPAILNGEFSGDAINDSLTTYLDSLFRPTFRESFLVGEMSEFRTALQSNSLLNWGPVTPVRLYHGTHDSTVYFQNTLTAFDSLSAYGALDIGLVPLPGADHLSGAFPSYYLALNWFDSLKSDLAK